MYGLLGTIVACMDRIILRHARKEKGRDGQGTDRRGRSEATGKVLADLSLSDCRQATGCAGKAWDTASFRVW